MQVTIGSSWSRGGDTLSRSVVLDDAGVDDRDVPVGNGISNLEVDLAFAFARLIAIFILSDRDVLLETNSSSAPDDVVNLKANYPFVWVKDAGVANPFDANVTKIFLTNASGAAAVVKIRALVDPTP